MLTNRGGGGGGSTKVVPTDRDSLLPTTTADKPASAVAVDQLRTEYRVLLGSAVAIILALLFGLVFGLRPVDNTSTIAALNTRITTLENTTTQLQANAVTMGTTVTHLTAEVMEIMMNGLAFSVRYMQNGTCAFGYSIVGDSAIQTAADYSDYVYINYTLKEVVLTPASIPLTVLTLSATPRPIVFPGYTPPITLPKDNDLTPALALWDPPILTLDALATNGFNLAYSYVMASRIKITPNCVATSAAEHDSAHCTEENAYSPRFTGSYPSPNAVQIFSNNLKVAGHTNMQFLWGQWDYTSLANQYDFVGTSVEFTDELSMLLPNL